jgi:hypothetical protein
MTTSVSSFIDEIADKASVDKGAAETAVGTILSVIQQEADQTVVAQLFKQLPGAAELAQQHVVTVGSGGGLLGTVSGALGGDAGLLVAALAQIEATGLSIQQIKNIGTALLAYIKENASPGLMKQITDAVPALREQFGHGA